MTKTSTMHIRSNGAKEWYLNDKRHREDGPAVEYADGQKEWYLNGKKVDQLVFWLTTKERLTHRQKHTIMHV